MEKGVLFVVQGEGRGHLTQAMALKKQLDLHKIPLLAVVIGKNSQRELPEYFCEKIKVPIYRIASPNFVYDKQKKGIDLLLSIKSWIRNFSQYIKGAKELKQITDNLAPVLIINFFEPLVPLCKIFAGLDVPVFSVAHQYIFEHRRYMFPQGHFFERQIIVAYTKFTGYGSFRKYALSLYVLPDNLKRKISVIPPLLRAEMYRQEISKHDFILAYLLNEGYIKELISFKTRFPHENIHIFTDKKGLTSTEEPMPGLFIHPLNDVAFLEKMAACKLLLSTAGFESIAEAMFLKKPVICVPVKGHFEQFCNSRDVETAGAGTYSDTFNPALIPNLLNSYRVNEKFTTWLNSRKYKIINDIISVTQ